MGTSVLLYEPYFSCVEHAAPRYRTEGFTAAARAGVRMPPFLSQALASEMCPCPLWVNRRLGGPFRHVRFTPNSGHQTVGRDVRFVPIAEQ